MNKKENELIVKDKGVLYSVMIVVVLIILLFGDKIALHYINKNPNPNNKIFGSGEKQNLKIDFLTEINIADFKNKIMNKESFLILSSRSSCEVCKIYMPDLKEIITKYKLKAYFINRDLFDTLDENYQILEKLEPNLSKHLEYTPYIMWFNKGVLIDEIIGKEEKKELEVFFDREEINLLEKGEI